MRALLFLTVVATAGTGCVAARPMAGPHGEARVELQCGGWAYQWVDCFERAQQVCGGHLNLGHQSMANGRNAFDFFGEHFGGAVVCCQRYHF